MDSRARSVSSPEEIDQAYVGLIGLNNVPLPASEKFAAIGASIGQPLPLNVAETGPGEAFGFVQLYAEDTAGAKVLPGTPSVVVTEDSTVPVDPYFDISTLHDSISLSVKP
jgi:hypothetical protein